MVFPHEKNFFSKIEDNYNGHADKIKKFYQETYLPVKQQLLDLDFSDNKDETFITAANIINDYYQKLDNFSTQNKITSQSKFRSTFLEEISLYLFSDNEFVKENKLGFYNHGVYIGLKIGNNLDINIMKKNVDFCIAKKAKIKLDKNESEIIVPVIAVEVKTYLDATMFGEVQFSSRLLKNATPTAKTYVLMETNQVKKEKIILARYDDNLNEMFVLRKSKASPIDYHVLKDYYNQICHDIKMLAVAPEIKIPGRLLHSEEEKI